MEITASQIQKERIKELEAKANALIARCGVAGIEDPKFRLLHFHTIEATFWIEGKFRTCKYK